MADLRVDLYCKNEDRVVAEIEIADQGVLNQYAIKRGLRNKIATHCPLNKDIRDGVALNCRCGAPLYFRSARGDLVLAVPGLSQVQG